VNARLKQRPLPQVDAPAHHAWREGWWQGIWIGIVIGAALAIMALR
jgi:hypothetical protein